VHQSVKAPGQKRRRNPNEDSNSDVDNERSNAEEDRLPGVEAHEGTCAVGRDSQKDDRRDKSQISDCASGIISEARLRWNLLWWNRLRWKRCKRLLCIRHI
jgi:hypothetical protein